MVLTNDEVGMNIGVMQADSISSVIFSMALERCKVKEIIIHTSVQTVEYIDDIAVVERDKSS